VPKGAKGLPGLALALAVAVAATVAGQHVPLVGSAVPGAVLGAVIALVIKPGARLAPGLKFASSFVLQCSVVLLGTQLSVAEAAGSVRRPCRSCSARWRSAWVRRGFTVGCSGCQATCGR